MVFAIAAAPAVQLVAPQLGRGLLTLSAGALVTVSTYFLATSTDIHTFGLSATVSVNTDIGPLGQPQLYYTNTAGSSTSAGCSADLTSSSGYTSTGSILCSNPDTDFGTGTAILSFFNAETSFGFYVGATSTIVTETSTATDDVPGQTVYLYTATDTTYESTFTSTSTVTLTGDLSVSYCSTSTPTDQTTSTTKPSTTPTTKPSTRPSTKSATKVSPGSSSHPSSPTPTSSLHHTCTKDRVYQTLAQNGDIAGHFCKDLLGEKHHKFPASISVWPAATISSACSCYGTDTLVKRTTTEYAPLTAYPVTAYSTSYNSTQTELVSTSVTISTSTDIVDRGTYTTTASTTATLDLRTPPTTCKPSPTTNKRKTANDPLVCSSFELQTAYLYVEVASPLRFCNYYLSAKRTRSPLLGLAPSILTDTCTCVLKDADEHIPSYESDLAEFYSNANGCNKQYEQVVKNSFKQSKAFCRYWGSKMDRGMTPIPQLSAAEIYSGCQCILA